MAEGELVVFVGTGYGGEGIHWYERIFVCWIGDDTHHSCEHVVIAPCIERKPQGVYRMGRDINLRQNGYLVIEGFVVIGVETQRVAASRSKRRILVDDRVAGK